MSPRTGSLTTLKSSCGLPVEIFETLAKLVLDQADPGQVLCRRLAVDLAAVGAMTVWSAQAGSAIRKQPTATSPAPMKRLAMQ
jgi:hypothetical protein